MTEGYIKLYRKILDNGWIRSHDLFIFWVWCLLKSTHKARTTMVGHQQVNLLPGQFIFGRERAIMETGLTSQNVRTCLAKLKNLKNITIKSTNKYSVITIINWDSYQNTNEVTNQQINIPLTNNSPTTNQQLTTDKNIKNIKNGKKKETPLISPQGENEKIKLLDFVFLTQIEKQKLIERFGEKGTKEYIERLNNYLGSKGKKYKSHYFTILNWAQKDGDRGANNGFRKLTEYETEMFKCAKMALDAKGHEAMVELCQQYNLKIKEVEQWITINSGP